VRAGLVGGLVGAVVAGAVAFGTVKVTDDHDAAAAPRSAAPSVVASPAALNGAFDIHGVLDKVGNAVVAIEVGQQRGRNIYGTGAGSGFIISDDGYVITNNHVVEGADAITVKFADGTEEDATLVGTSATHDVAVVKIGNIHGATPLKLADSTNLRVGDDVLAIGNALDLGDSPTVTLGIVSAKGRTIDTQSENGAAEHLEGLIQTDAAINPGNSGGPLVNAAGEVVGINSAGVQGANNIGFAIDINSVKDVIDQLKQGKDVAASDPFLGVGTASVSDLDDATREQYGVTVDQGAVVTEVVPGSAAADAGLQVGDVIVKADGKDVTSSDDLRTAIVAKKPGDKMTVDVKRDGADQSVEVTVGSRSETNS
jgi:S1-C subfamily serine protease